MVERASERHTSKRAASAEEVEPASQTSAAPPPRSAGDPSSEVESIGRYNISDVPTQIDSLGFEPYVDAVADFLTNPETRAPLTMSVEGSWGSGKSSFMLQLKELLESKYHETTIEFNAWRYDRADSLAAAFAMEFLRQLSARVGLLQRWRAAIKLYCLRFNWKEGWLDLARSVAVWLAVLAGTLGVAIFLTANHGTAVLNAFTNAHSKAGPDGGNGAADALWSAFLAAVVAGGWGGGILAALMLAAKLKELVGEPLASDLRKFVQAPNYEDQVGFLGRFHEDFAKIVACYVAKRRVFVFIDDLDRCEIPKAAELVQGLNLMISDAEQLIFIIGMDRDKVAASLAVKFEKVLPYLKAASDRGPDDNYVNSRFGLEFGYNFVEKFVQLPFRVPQPRNEIRRLLANLGARAEAVALPKPGETEQRRRNTLLKISFGNDSPRVIEIGNLVAPALDFNPRRIKGFLNLFRLKTYIAASTGLFDEVDSEAEEEFEPLTLEQLAKFVVICLRWPLFLEDLNADVELLSALEVILLDSEAVVGDHPALTHWSGRVDLTRFLKVGLEDDSMRWSMKKVNVAKLLVISPATRGKGDAEAASGKSSAKSDEPPTRESSGIHVDVKREGIGSDQFEDPKSVAPFA